MKQLPKISLSMRAMLFIVLAACALSALAQTVSQPQEVTAQPSAKLNVIVLDKSESAAGDVTKEEFRVFEDEVEQAISTLSAAKKRKRHKEGINFPSCLLRFFNERKLRRANQNSQSGAASDIAGLRIDAHDFAFLDKERHAHLQSCFKRRRFGRASGSRVAAHARFRALHF